ncbi:MAG: hypothetical protein J6H21_05060 [Firmicutes bacterium]|nr:hypothetical protein [Bacillota bacterium]
MKVSNLTKQIVVGVLLVVLIVMYPVRMVRAATNEKIIIESLYIDHKEHAREVTVSNEKTLAIRNENIKNALYPLGEEKGLEKISSIKETKRLLEEERKRLEEEERKRREEERIAALINDSGNKAEYKRYAYEQFGRYGWSDGDFECLVALWNRESGWNPNSHNSYSGAHGIPQALPASKMAAYGSDYYTNYRPQILWGLQYIASRYGSPSRAWSHFCSTGWY